MTAASRRGRDSAKVVTEGVAVADLRARDSDGRRARCCRTAIFAASRRGGGTVLVRPRFVGQALVRALCHVVVGAMLACSGTAVVASREQEQLNLRGKVGGRA